MGQGISTVGGRNEQEYKVDTHEKVLALDPEVIELLPDSGPETNDEHKSSLKLNINSADTVQELFEQLADLRQQGLSKTNHLKQRKPNSKPDSDRISSKFGFRVKEHEKRIHTCFEIVLKEKMSAEQRQLAAKTLSKTQLKTNPPSLPPPTEACMVIGWDMVIHLLKNTQQLSREVYLSALKMLHERIRGSKPLAYADGNFLSPSATTAFNSIADFLASVAKTGSQVDVETVAILIELALVRGSLPHLLKGVKYLLLDNDSLAIQISPALNKLSSIKEQPLYGIVESTGDLFCCGQNSYGELGLGDDIERRRMTKVSLAGWDVKQVSSGNEILCIVSTAGTLLTCGLNKSGQCGHGHFEERIMQLRPVKALSSHRVNYIAVANGSEHMIAITDGGLAYSWGYNDRGQLGHGTTTSKIHTPTLIEALQEQCAITAGVSYHHSAVVTDDGSLYTFGMNDCGQLGIDSLQHQSIPQPVAGLEGTEVKSVACGLYHTVVCTSIGEVYSFGKNDYGQLGIGHNRPSKSPAFVLIPSENAVDVSCGYYHCVVVTASGNVFSFGRNDYGQLGIGNKVHQNTPQLASCPPDTKIVKSASGCYHSLILTDQSKAFVFGRNNKGQLGLRNAIDSATPIPLRVRPDDFNRPIMHISAGFYTSSVLVERQSKNAQDSEVQYSACSWLTTLCGRVDIDESGEVEGLSNFGSISVVNVALRTGVWYYEVKLSTSGLIQIGWVDGYFQASSDQGEGVGDHVHSWSYDGNRQRRWNSGSSPYGDRWKIDDVIGCLLDLDQGKMHFYRNGVDLGCAYSDIKVDPLRPLSAFVPAISLERSEIITVNLGNRPFVYPPTNASGVIDAMEANVASIKTNSLVSTNVARPLLGSSSVYVDGDIFVVGGAAPGSGACSSDVWIFHTTTKEWEKWSSLPVPIQNHQVVRVSLDHILVIGGEETNSASRHMKLWLCSTVRVMQDGCPVLPKWTQVQATLGAAVDMPAGRAFHTAAVLNGRLDPLVFIYGGKSNTDEILGDSWVLSLGDYAWSKLPSAHSLEPGPRLGCTICTTGEFVYLFGGHDKEGTYHSDLWRYNAFDRVWQMCYDDTRLSFLNETSTFGSAPTARSHYAAACDYGNIYIYGGSNENDEMLSDMWKFSIALESWTRLPVETGDVDACKRSRATFLYDMGTMVSFSKTSDEGLLLCGGIKQRTNGPIKAETGILKLSSSQYGTTITIDSASQNDVVVSTSLKASEDWTSDTCIESKEAATHILANIDRLAGGALPLENPETVQSSPCFYRSLCIDPNKETFSVFLELLQCQSNRYFLESTTNPKILLPFLATLRLMKLNFYELVRSRLDLEDAGFIQNSQSGQDSVLVELKDLLFKLADYEPSISQDKELAQIHRNIRLEVVATVHAGHSILFPKLDDQLQLYTSLVSRRDAEDKRSALDDILLPLLVPKFTSSSMLFFIMRSIEKADESANSNAEAVSLQKSLWVLAGALFESLWTITMSKLKKYRSNVAKLQEEFLEVEASSEFKCLNVIHRAAMYWASLSDENGSGWILLSQFSSKLLQYGSEIIESSSESVPAAEGLIVSMQEVLRMSFVGKFLPLSLLGISAMPKVAYNFSAFGSSLWTGVEHLMEGINSYLANGKSQNRSIDGPPTGRADSDNSQEQLLSLESQSCTIKVSEQLLLILGLSDQQRLTLGDLYKNLWLYLQQTPEVDISRINPESVLIRRGFMKQCQTFYRVSVPDELAIVVGVPYLIVSSLKELDLRSPFNAATMSFECSRMVLSQQYNLMSGTTDQHASVLPPPAPMGRSATSEWVNEAHTVKSSGSSEQWLEDLQHILSWFGSQYARSLVSGVSILDEEIELKRWIASPLFRGGLELSNSSKDLSDRKNESEPRRRSKYSLDLDFSKSSALRTQRNRTIIEQILENVEAGKQILDKVRKAIDPEAKSKLNPKLASRLRRQDSVELTLQKSGGFEAVDRAVRAAFIVLLKHSNISYVKDALREDGSPSEELVDAWRAALQLRRWIVREQQKLAAESKDAENESKLEIDMDAESSSRRQMILYEQVCAPIIERALLLLRLTPVPVPREPQSSPFKLLPGISTASSAFKSTDSSSSQSTTAEQSVRQLKKLMETKSMEILEEEDERIHSDIFSFLQQPIAGGSETTLHTKMKNILERQQTRAIDRTYGLHIFQKMLASTSSVSRCRHHILSLVAVAFRNETEAGESSKEYTKRHHLDGLEMVGAHLSNSVSQSFFGLAKSLIDCSKLNLTESSDIEQDVQDILLSLDICSMPYRDGDWQYVDNMGLAKYVAEFTSWDGWRDLLIADSSQSHSHIDQVDFSSDMMALGVGLKSIRFICGNNIQCNNKALIISSLHRAQGHAQVKKDIVSQCRQNGGLAVAKRPMFGGRWYWEVSVNSQSSYPVFVGLASESSDLNDMLNGGQRMGIYIGHGKSCIEIPGQTTLAWRQHEPLGVLFDCESGTIEYYAAKKILHTVQLQRSEGSFTYYAAIGVLDAQVSINIYGPIPHGLWLAKPVPAIENLANGGIVPVPKSQSAICWTCVSNSSAVNISTDGLVIAAQNSTTHSPCIRTNRSFSSGQVFMELRSLSLIGDNPIISLSVLSESIENMMDSRETSSIHIRLDCLTPVNGSDTIGVLYNFDEGSITILHHRSKSVVEYFDASKSVFPAIGFINSTGTVIHTNFHPEERGDISTAALLQPIVPVGNKDVPDKSPGDPLEMDLVSCDGGEFSDTYSCENCLQDDDSVFSSISGSNIHMILKHSLDRPFCLTHITVRGPGTGFTAPLQHALVFVTSELPNMDLISQFDSMTMDEFCALPCSPDNSNHARDPTLPVMFITLDSSASHMSKCLRRPVTGRYVVVTLLRPIAGTNIDVGHIGIFGYEDEGNGIGYSSCVHDKYCSACSRTSFQGVCYVSTRDPSDYLCPTCYDDNRGILEETYTIMPVDFDEQEEDDGEPMLCQPRNSWIEKVSSGFSFLPRKDAAKSSDAGPCSEEGVFYEEIELYACGQNNYGELCLGHCNSTSHLENVPSLSGKSIVQLAGGNEMLGIVLSDGTLLTCGLNKSGQCGHGTFEERILTAEPVKALNGIPIKTIGTANGCEHVLAATRDGALYSWGYNDRGQLGLGITVSKTNSPKLVESLSEYKIVAVGVSYHHSAAVAETGELFTFGMNDCGQLGLGTTQHQVTPQLVEGLEGVRLIGVSCGLYHTVAVSDAGDVYSFGKNDYGQLGLGHTRHVKVPTKLPEGLDGEIVIQISCGYYHTVLLCKSGKTLTFGRNDYGQLGIGNKVHQNSPTNVPLPATSKITTIACGCYHTLLLTEQGRILAFGRNNKGQLGAGSRSLASAELPMPIPPTRLGEDPVVNLAAGFYSTYIVTGKVHNATDGKKKETEGEDIKTDVNSGISMYEALMKEIDRRGAQELTASEQWYRKRAPLSKQQLQLLKLQAGAWAAMRILLYQSLGTTVDRRHGKNPVLATLLSSMLEGLNCAYPVEDTSAVGSDKTPQALDTTKYFCLTDACVGLFRYCSSVALPTSDSDESCKKTSLQVSRRLYCNQILQVLLTCGSADSSVSRILSHDSTILQHVLRGVIADELPSATISLRLGMLLFPLQSLGTVNKALKSILPEKTLVNSSIASRDILTFLLHLAGSPLVSWPRLCGHDIGVISGLTEPCAATNCLKGLNIGKPDGITRRKEEILHVYYTSMAKSAEAVCVLRYLALYPSWRTAIIAALRRGLEIGERFPVHCKTIAEFSEQHVWTYSDKSKQVRPVGQSRICIESSENQTNTLRLPESTSDEPQDTETAPEIDEGGTAKSSTSDTKPENAPESDKFTLCKDLMLSGQMKEHQRVAEALDEVSLLMAAVCVIGGHTEIFREGGHVLLADEEYEGRDKSGVLVKVNQNAQGALQACVELQHSGYKQDDDVPFIHGTAKKEYVTKAFIDLQPVDQVPAIPTMFEALSDCIGMVSTLALNKSSLNVPDVSNTILIPQSATRQIASQMQWRAMKALTTLVNHVRIESDHFSSSSLLTNLAALLSREKSTTTFHHSSRMQRDKKGLSDELVAHQRRWHAIKQRSITLSTYHAIDNALDNAEEKTRQGCVSDFAKDGQFTWISNSSILSPKNAIDTSKKSLDDADSTKLPTPRFPPGVWGTLQALPQAIDSTDGPAPNHPTLIELRDDTISFGRATDNCDVVISDRSVSGRHFQLRRILSGEDTGAYVELEDFSKNGTIVDGLRVHASCRTIASSSRISLILSRGGLLTYEFTANLGQQDNTPGTPVGLSISTDLQQPTDIVGPRSPAEIQNRGDVRNVTIQTPTQGGVGHGGARSRSRLGLQRLRLTHLGEDDPRALNSPNPAMDSPRRSGLVSPRFSGVVSPRTPRFEFPSGTNNVMSPLPSPVPAARSSPPVITADSQVLMQSERQGLKNEVRNFDRRRLFYPKIVNQAYKRAFQLQQRVVKELKKDIDIVYCNQALISSNGNEELALQWLSEHANTFEVDLLRRRNAAENLSRILGRPVALCLRALALSSDNIGKAMEVLVSSGETEDDSNGESSCRVVEEDSKLDDLRTMLSELKRMKKLYNDWVSDGEYGASQSIGDGMFGAASDLRISTLMESENPSYRLLNSSSPRNSPRGPAAKIPESKAKLLASKEQSRDVHWWDCIDPKLTGNVDAYLGDLDMQELEREELMISESLIAIYARKLLQQIISFNKKDAEFCEVAKSVTWRPALKQLVTFEGQFLDHDNSIVSSELLLPPARLQHIHGRVVDQLTQASTKNTMRQNLDTLRNVTTLTNSLHVAQNRNSTSVVSELLAILVQADDVSQMVPTARHPASICEDMVMETLMHALSCVYAIPRSLDIASSKPQREIKGPILLSCGIQVVVTKCYEKLWCLPRPDPLLAYRHSWRRRGIAEPIKKCIEPTLAVWRPCVPPSSKTKSQALEGTWYSFGDVLQSNDTADPPNETVFLLRDDENGLLAPPISFERVDVTGRGLPMSEKSKQTEPEKFPYYSLWWPIAPEGYVSMGCVAGKKDMPDDAPTLDSVRCIRSDLVDVVKPFQCVWQSETPENETEDTDGMKNQPNEPMTSSSVGIGLWRVDAELCTAIIPSLVRSRSSKKTEPVFGYAIKLTDTDRTLCAPVSAKVIASFVNGLLNSHQSLLMEGSKSAELLRPELSSALLSLIYQELQTATQGGDATIELVRALARLIRQGCPCNDTAGILFCRSKLMKLHRMQDGNTMLSGLLQALVELLLAVECQRRSVKMDAYKRCKDLSFTALPYEYELNAQVEGRILDHSSKISTEISKNKRNMRVICNPQAKDNKINRDHDLDQPNQTESSIRFSNSALSVGLGKIPRMKSRILYFEVTLVGINLGPKEQVGVQIGFSDSRFPLDDQSVGSVMNSYGYIVSTGNVACEQTSVDMWDWNVLSGAPSIGDTFGAGLCLDSHEIFFTRNGSMLGIAFSSIRDSSNLFPTISISTKCELKVSLGEKSSTGLDFKFNFGSIDWDDSLRHIEWIKPVSELYSIMDSLSNSPTRRLPDEFMLSADTFLSIVSQDECITVESEHPYTQDPCSGVVHIPLSTSMRIKLDPECETLNSHCLQIVQGNTESAETATMDGDVRTFTGACGGQEVTLSGNSFVWKFPLQSNFQCRLDRTRKGPHIKLENRETRIALTKDKGWQCVLGLARFDGGVHCWEVKIVAVTSSSNIFLGVAKRDVRLDSYLGKDNRGWGWIGNRALWHNGSKQRGTYGEKFTSGDVVRMTLDLNKGTLSYALNGKDLGVAFGPGGTGPKLHGPIYPGFAVYNQRDCIELIGGHRIEDAGASSGDMLTYDSADDLSESEEDVPSSRVTMACELSALGFPIDWCVFALKNCDDDTARAADFILTNIGDLEALVREDAEEQARRHQMRRERARKKSEAATTTGTETEDSTETSGASSDIDKYGIKFTAIPEFTTAGRCLLAAKHSERLEKLHSIHCKFTLEQDEDLTALIDEECNKKPSGSNGSDPLKLTSEELEFQPEDLRRYPSLMNLSAEEIRSRFTVIRNFNLRLQLALPLIDFTAKDDRSVLTQGVRKLRGIIFRSVKLVWWTAILREQQSPASARPEIELDRHIAGEIMQANVPTEKALKGTVFAQAFTQLHPTDPSLLRGTDRAFKCQFVGEFGDDFGGLYRECLAQMSTELQSKVLPLLVPCPNAIHDVGGNRDLFVPNVHVRKDSRQIQMLEFIGKLMGMAIRSNNPLDLNLPSIVWKPLVSEQVDRMDIESIHQGCFQVVDTINNISKHDVTSEMFDDLIDATFTVLSSDGNEVELVPGGRTVRVAWDDKDEYAHAVETYRINEFKAVCQDIKRGMATIIPSSTTCMFTWQELQVLVCGKPTVDVELLRRRTIYGDGCSASDPHIEYFWQALSSFTEEQKSLFLRFVWGRSRLPPHASDFTQDFKISGMSRAAGNPNAYLPLAHTCFFSIDLPAYSSLDAMKERLLYAITHCQAIDADNTTVAQRSAQLGNWSHTESNGSTI